MSKTSVRDNGNNRWKRKRKSKDRKKERCGSSYIESVRTEWFCCRVPEINASRKAMELLIIKISDFRYITKWATHDVS